MVLLYFRLFNRGEISVKTDAEPEQFNQSELPLDETVQTQNHRNKAVDLTHKVKRTYHLERRTFL